MSDISYPKLTQAKTARKKSDSARKLKFFGNKIKPIENLNLIDLTTEKKTKTTVNSPKHSNKKKAEAKPELPIVLKLIDTINKMDV